MTLTTTGQGYANGNYVLTTSGAAAITVSSIVTAWGTPGSWSGYQARYFITPIG